MDDFQKALESLLSSILYNSSSGETTTNIQWYKALRVLATSNFRHPIDQELSGLAVDRAKSLISFLRRKNEDKAKENELIDEIRTMIDAIYSIPTEPRERYVLR